MNTKWAVQTQPVSFFYSENIKFTGCIVLLHQYMIRSILSTTIRYNQICTYILKKKKKDKLNLIKYLSLNTFHFLDNTELHIFKIIISFVVRCTENWNATCSLQKNHQFLNSYNTLYCQGTEGICSNCFQKTMKLNNFIFKIYCSRENTLL